MESRILILLVDKFSADGYNNLIKSIKKFNPDHPKIRVITNHNLSEGNGIEVYYTKKKYTDPWLYKLDIFKQTDLDFGIYLDLDILCTAPLTELFTVDNWTGADLWIREDIQYLSLTHKNIEVGSEADKKVNDFNCGVMVVNRPMFTGEFGVKVDEIAATGGFFPFGDQSIITMFQNEYKYGKLPTKWNAYSYEVISGLVKNPSLIHFAGQIKPWDLNPALVASYYLYKEYL